MSLPNDKLARQITMAKNAGFAAIRIDVDWSAIEPVRGVRNWSNTDRVVNAIIAQGLCPLGVAAYTPTWATEPGNRARSSHYRPANPATFASFVQAAASRYRTSVRAWEIWNEPNLASFYSPSADAVSYGELLKASHTAIKKVDRNLLVLSGGLAPATDNGLDIAPTTFLTSLYARGFNKYLDAVAMHPYTYPSLPDDPSSAEWNAAMQMWPMHDLMTAHGDGGKRIWITESGAPTGTARVAVSEAVQAETVRIVVEVAQQTPWLGPVFVYSIQDAGADKSDPEQNFGLYRHDGTSKASVQVTRRFAGLN